MSQNRYCSRCAQTVTDFADASHAESFVLLHQFRKKSQKTPKREIEKAKRERDDYLLRREHNKL